MLERSLAAAAMGFRDQRRRPLLLILLVVVPAYAVTRSIAITLPTPREIGLPDGAQITTTMKAIHGASMAGMTIAFVASLCGVFVMQSALAGDRRLVIAGFRPGETVLARLLVLGAATSLLVAVAMTVTAVSFEPRAWLPFAGAAALIGLIYAGIGALAGAVLDRIAATYLMLFLALVDLGIVQNPMFGDGEPGQWAFLLPGYGPSRVMVDGAFGDSFGAGPELVVSLAWLAATLIAVRRSMSPSYASSLQHVQGFDAQRVVGLRGQPTAGLA